VPLVPGRQSGLVVLGSHLQRGFAEKDPQRWFLCIDHLQDGAAGGDRVARSGRGGPVLGSLPSALQPMAVPFTFFTVNVTARCTMSPAAGAAARAASAGAAPASGTVASSKTGTAATTATARHNRLLGDDRYGNAFTEISLTAGWIEMRRLVHPVPAGVEYPKRGISFLPQHIR